MDPFYRIKKHVEVLTKLIKAKLKITLKTKPKLRPKVTSKGTLKTKPKIDENWAMLGNYTVYLLPKRLYQFKITLLHSDPPIWRRILVSEEYNFFHLHLAIQNAMGWKDCHLHRFQVRDKTTKKRIDLGGSSLTSFLFDFDDDNEDKQSKVERRTKISKYFKTSGDKALYTYDFGDNWVHLIEFEGRKVPMPRTDYPKCIDGERACPPEDSGGTYGYKRLIRIMTNRAHKEHDDMKEWLEEVHGIERFRPEHFNPKQVCFF